MVPRDEPQTMHWGSNTRHISLGVGVTRHHAEGSTPEAPSVKDSSNFHISDHTTHTSSIVLHNELREYRELIEKGYMSLAFEDFKQEEVNVSPDAIPSIIGSRGAIIQVMANRAAL